VTVTTTFKSGGDMSPSSHGSVRCGVGKLSQKRALTQRPLVSLYSGGLF